MRGLNKAMIIGRLGKDPVMRYTPNGQAVANFSIATDEVWSDRSGERKTRTEWHNIVAWAKLAETCGQYLKKGKLVYVEGRLQTRQWEDQSGGKRQTTEIVINEMVILEPKGGAMDHPAGPEYPEAAPAKNGIVVNDNPITDDDVPF